jgi:hypothetical protein
MALGLVVAGDIINDALIYYVRGKALAQTMEERPLLKMLREKQKTFSSGNLQVSEPIQGTYMSDTAGFFTGYQEDDTLPFSQAQNVVRAVYPWKEVAAGLIISHTELKKDGIHITDHQKESESSDVELTRLTGILENRLEDFAESWARMMNFMYWKDGTQDAKQTPGVLSILTDTPAVGVTGGINRAAAGYTWWQHRALVGGNKIVASAGNQTLSKTLRSELRQLRRYQGKPDSTKCGSGFMDALELEVEAKGIYTQEGFAKTKNDLGMNVITMRGLGNFEYDPTLDDLGYSKRCYVFDSRRLVLRPMEMEQNKVLTPERPYQYLVFLRTMTDTSALVATQLNCHGVYEVA